MPEELEIHVQVLRKTGTSALSEGKGRYFCKQSSQLLSYLSFGNLPQQVSFNAHAHTHTYCKQPTRVPVTILILLASSRLLY